MQIHQEIQGSPEWCQLRLNKNGSSEAAAMLGIPGANMTRTELLRLKKYGLGKEFSEWVQKYILDKGHEVEASARPIFETNYGIDLYPVTCSDGKLLASCDGRSLDGKTVWEHKQYNQKLFDSTVAGQLPEEHMPQCQQILMVTGADVLYFTVSDGTTDKMAILAVYPDAAWFERLRDGWAQFQKDEDSYQPVHIDEKPAARAVIELPALVLHAEGRLVNSNLDAFQNALALHLAETRKLVYLTDEDFSNASAVAKMYRDTCKKLELAKESMLAQTVTIGEAAKIIDACHEDLRVTSLQIEKDVTRHTEAKKIALINEGQIAFTTFIAELEAGITPIRLNCTMPDFATAIKNKRLFSAMHDAVQTCLANAKVEYTKIAGSILHNLAFLGLHNDYRFLFNDLQNIIYKDNDDFQLLVISRVAEHKKREEEKLEAERQRIIAEERARAEREARIAAEKSAEEERARIESADFIKAQNEQAAAVTQTISMAEPIAQAQNPAPLPGNMFDNMRSHFIQMTATPTLRLGQISERLGFTVTSEFLRKLGFEHSARDKSAMLYHECQFTEICVALIQHIQSLQTVTRKETQAA